MGKVVHDVPRKNEKKPNNSHWISSTKSSHLKARNPKPKMHQNLLSGAPKCAKTLLYQNMRYNPNKAERISFGFIFLFRYDTLEIYSEV